MPRIARLVVPDYPHHVTARGNYRQNIFKDDAGRKQYLAFIADYSKEYHLTILSYCLMDNHVHFIAVPHKENSLAKVFSGTHVRYSQYFNKKLHVRGHLWQGRFYSCVLNGAHLLAAVRYVERNPVRVRLVKRASDYKWSSAKSHSVLGASAMIDTNQLFKYVDITQEKWKNFIEAMDKPEDILEIRRNTMTGRPLGDDLFVQKLEKKFNIRLHALAHGRPRKAE